MIFKLMKNRNFRNYFFSDIIADFGIGMLATSLNWYVLDKTDSSKMIGYMLSANVIAGFIVSLVIGLLIDRINRKHIIIANYMIRVVSTALILALLYVTEFRWEYAFLLTCVNGVCWTVNTAASKSFVQEIIEKDELISGNSLLEISMQVGMFMAGALSGLLYKFFGFQSILLMNTFIFLISIVFVCNIRYTSKVTAINSNNSVRKNIKDGINYFRNNKYIFLFGMVSFVPTVVTSIYNVVLPVYVVRVINGDSIIFGIADMAYGIGGFISGFIAVYIAKKMSNNKAIIMFYLVAIGILIGICFNQYALVLYVISCTLGITNSSIRIIVNTVLLSVVPKEVMGRVMSVWVSISLIVQAISSSFVGTIIDSYSSKAGFLFMGFLMILGCIFNLCIFRKFNIAEVEKINE